jgi:hypothetical protein
MMRQLLKLPLVIALLAGFLFTSCQKEDEEFINLDNEETVTANSQFTNLLLRSAQNFGIIDDLIDGNSCATIKFPFTVIANGQKVTLQDEDDFDIIEDIFDQFPNDQDTLEIVFPITLILEDYTEVIVNNQQELDALVAACDSSGGSNSIGCVEFVYPITFFIYNENQQQTGTVTVNSDLELYLFLSGLDSDDFISLQFPVSVILSDGSTVEVNSNAELQQLIEGCDNSTTDPVDPSELEQFLTDGVWYVTYFFDDLDETSDFNGYEFSFFADNTAQATNGSNTVPGSWSLSGSSTPDLILNFGTTEPFDELDEDWDIIEATSEIIRLRDVSGDGSIDYLTFERTPATGGGGTTTNEFINTITNGNWYVNLLDDEGEIETCDYVQYQFVYNIDGTVTATSSTNTVNGFWTVQNDSSGLDLILNFDLTGEDDPFEDLNDDWDVTAYNQDEIALLDVSGGGGGTDVLVFGRNPATGCGATGNVQLLIDTLSDGQWFVAQYLDDGNDETGNYNGYTLVFDSSGVVEASNGSTQINGTWLVALDGGQLELTLDFGAQIPFDEISDDWDVLSFTNSVVDLEDVSGGGGGTDNLRFEKL